MTSAARTSISSFPRGHEFPSVEFTISTADIGAYLDAVGDGNDYRGSVPPLCAVALALNALQEQIALPEGSLHTGQEVEHLSLVLAGDSLRLTGRIAQRSERQGFVISIIEFEVAAADGVAVRARTTIMAPGAPS
jgi:hypothetical protein